MRKGPRSSAAQSTDRQPSRDHLPVRAHDVVTHYPYLGAVVADASVRAESRLLDIKSTSAWTRIHTAIRTAQDQLSGVRLIEVGRPHRRPRSRRETRSSPLVIASPLEALAGTRNVTATGNIRGCGSANRAWIASVSFSISPGISPQPPPQGIDVPLELLLLDRSHARQETLLVVRVVQLVLDRLLQLGQNRRDVVRLLLGPLGEQSS